MMPEPDGSSLSELLLVGFRPSARPASTGGKGHNDDGEDDENAAHGRHRSLVLWIASCGNARSTGLSTSGPTTGVPNPRERRRRTSRYVPDRGTKTGTTGPTSASGSYAEESTWTRSRSRSAPLR